MLHNAWSFFGLAITVAACIGAVSAPDTSARIVDLRCEYLREPINVDVASPRLSWQMESAERGQRQTAYQILVASSSQVLEQNLGDLWDSGKIEGDRSGQIVYGGNALASRQQCFWKVMCWDKAGASLPWSAPATWMTALQSPSDWTARWIGRESKAADGADSKSIPPMPIFRRDFQVTKPVRRATAYISGLGQFEMSINGEKVGQDLLQPGWTNYRKTCQYVALDLTDKIKTGANTIGVMLGNGMYNVVGGRYAKFRGSFGPLKLIAQVYIDYADGSTDLIVSDDGWKTADGPITFSCIYGGEDFDARDEPPGWNQPGFDDAAWTHAAFMEGPGGKLVASSRSGPPIRVAGSFPATTITEPRPGVFVYDTGQNASQIPKIRLQGAAGATVRLTPGELLDGSGLVSQKSSGGPSYCQYTLKGREPETWSPRFYYYGARYYQIDGAVPADRAATSPGAPVVLDLTGQFITASADGVGTFACSNETFTRTAALIDWAIRSNLMSVLTDCPHREKLGWLEQVHLMGPSIMYRYDLATMMTKTCSDIADAQAGSGLVPDIAPEFVAFKGGFLDSPEWGSACLLIPWQLYEWYGDIEVLRSNYDVMQRYVDYLGSKSKNGIVSHGLGDWYDLGPKPPGRAQLTPVPLTATAFYYLDVVTLQKIAVLLDRQDDAARYAALAGEIAGAFNNTFYDKSKMTYAGGSQTGNSIPLVFGLVPQADRAAVLSAVIKDVQARGNALTAGDVGYRYLLEALGDGGRSDIIFDMNSRADRPGYGFILNKGATALTEAWDARDSSSQNHFMLGHIMQWFYRDLAGIRPDQSAVGFRKIIIKPAIVGDVTWVKAEFNSVNGTIGSSWRRENGRTTLNVKIPANTSATVYVPTEEPDSVMERDQPAAVSEGVRFLRAEEGYAVFSVQSGLYAFSAR